MKAPYFAVIFTSTLIDSNDPNYHQFSKLMDNEVQKTPGFLGKESYREDSGKGVTISYWESQKAIEHWKKNTQHLLAQRYGKDHAYSSYELKICKVERAYKYSTLEGNQKK